MAGWEKRTTLAKQRTGSGELFPQNLPKMRPIIAIGMSRRSALMNNTDDYYTIAQDQVSKQMEALFPHGSGTASSHRVEHALNAVAQVAFRTGQSAALMTLSTTDDVAALYGVSARSIRVRAKRLHEQFALGWQVPGTSQWLFTPEEVERLRPDERFRPKSLDAE